MERSQTARLLAKAQLIDSRTVDQLTVEAWHEVVGHLAYDDAMAALTEHRRTSTEYLTPAHIVAGVARIRRARLDRGTAAEGVPDADPDDVTAWLAALRDGRTRVADGERPRRVQALVSGVAATTRVPAREDTRARQMRQADQEAAQAAKHPRVASRDQDGEIGPQTGVHDREDEDR